MLVYFRKNFLFIIVLLLSVSFVFSSDTLENSRIESGVLRAVVLEDWDKAYEGASYGWRLLGDKESKFIGPDGEVKYDNPVYNPVLDDPKVTSEFTREVKLVNGSVSNLQLSKPNERKVLGLKFNFAFPGYNNVVIEPPKIDLFKINRRNHSLDYNQVKEDFIYGIEVPGRVSKFSVWVLSRNYNYDLEAIVEDYQGQYHFIKFGSLRFIGWRPLIGEVPVSIKQSSKIYPPNRNLVFKKFIIRSKPNSEIGPSYIFFDELKALVDAYVPSFDGSNINFDRQDCINKNRDKLDEKFDCSDADLAGQETETNSATAENPTNN